MKKAVIPEPVLDESVDFYGGVISAMHRIQALADDIMTNGYRVTDTFGEMTAEQKRLASFVLLQAAREIQPDHYGYVLHKIMEHVEWAPKTPETDAKGNQ